MPRLLVCESATACNWFRGFDGRYTNPANLTKKPSVILQHRYLINSQRRPIPDLAVPVASPGEGDRLPNGGGWRGRLTRVRGAGYREGVHLMRRVRGVYDTGSEWVGAAGILPEHRVRATEVERRSGALRSAPSTSGLAEAGADLRRVRTAVEIGSMRAALAPAPRAGIPGRARTGFLWESRSRLSRQEASNEGVREPKAEIPATM